MNDSLYCVAIPEILAYQVIATQRGLVVVAN